jgi:hypothetical protein
MAEWLVRLRGEPRELRLLSWLMSLPEWRITEESGEYYLCASAFQAMTEVADVRSYALRLITIINGSAALRLHSDGQVVFGGVVRAYEDGRQDAFTFGALIVVQEGNMLSATGSVSGAPSTLRPSRQQTAVDTDLSVALQHQSVEDALRFMGFEKNWFNLAKVFETIEQDVGGEDILIKQFKDQIGNLKDKTNAFTGSANNAGVSGDDARHAPSRYPKRPKKIMSLDEAKVFIRALLDLWIASKSS